MITFNRRVSADTPAQHSVKLPYHQRVKGRLRIETQDGLDAGIFVDRGSELKDGEKLSDDEGRVLEIKASAESVSVATTQDALLFARACYHIGNRHAEVQIESNQLVYLHDAVLDDMLRQLGLSVSASQRAFMPENGAYARGHAHGAHSHHTHGHETHSHEHEQAHTHEHS